MVDWITNFIETIGYPGIALLMFLEIPIPVIQSEIVMTFSGFAARNGGLNIVGVAISGIVGSQAASVALYWVTRQFDQERVDGFLDRYGGWLGFTCENLQKGEDFFDRHDRKAVLIGRFVPGLRSFIAIPAGLRRMSFWTFFVMNLVGTAFWVSVLTALGAVLGQNYGLVDQYSSYITYTFLAAVVLFVAYRIGKVVHGKVTRDESDKEPSHA